MTALIKEINQYINQLTPAEQEQLAIALKKQLLLTGAERLSSFTPGKTVRIQEIVKEVRRVRKKSNGHKSSN